MPLKIYNTLTKSKQEFIPITPGKVSMYVCGVTVYDFCHLGHGRAYVAFDIIHRYLKHKGYDVKYVRNITDIDDKIIARANEMDMPNASLMEKCLALTKKFTDEFHKDAESLNLLPANNEPKATEYIPQMIALINKLIEKGFAYAVGGEVYYDISKFNDYGKLSGKNTEELQAGARVEADKRKKNPLDFSLWKEAKPNEPFWESPWGKGRPGWHIECSAMSLNLLGEEFDIHGGGQDLIFPHHENEIAQTCGCTGKQPVRYWIHNGFVTTNREKMSKSLGNFFTLRDIFKQYDPMTVRFFLLTQHYKSPVDFSDQLLGDAGNALKRIEECLTNSLKYISGEKFAADVGIREKVLSEFYTAMDDDFNTAKALAIIFDVVKEINNCITNGSAKKEIYSKTAVLVEMLDLLGIRCRTHERVEVKSDIEVEMSEKDLDILLLSDELNNEIKQKLLAVRNHYKKTKQWVLADKIRDNLAKRGLIIQDGKGVSVIVKKICPPPIDKS